MEIVIVNGNVVNTGDVSWDPIAELGHLTVYEETPRDKLIERISGADIVLNNISVLNARIIEACPNLKYIGSLATGYNLIDTEAARRAGITVTNIPEYGTPAVSQHTLALLLELCNQVGRYNDKVQTGQWGQSGKACYWEKPLTELWGKTLGIIGYGSIGRAVGAIASAMGMKIIANARTPKPELESEHVRYADIGELYRESDVISLHCPLFKETENIICAESISRMKDGVLIINSARGGLINENDLSLALKSGKVGGAAVDVLSREPAREDNPLLGAPNCIITPHIAWAPTETRARLVEVAAENIRAFLRGEPINVVN